MNDLAKMLGEIKADLKVVSENFEAMRADNLRLVRENNQLKARVDELLMVNASDDLADAAKDRERDKDFERSADYQARGERE